MLYSSDESLSSLEISRPRSLILTQPLVLISSLSVTGFWIITFGRSAIGRISIIDLVKGVSAKLPLPKGSLTTQKSKENLPEIFEFGLTIKLSKLSNLISGELEVYIWLFALSKICKLELIFFNL